MGHNCGRRWRLWLSSVVSFERDNCLRREVNATPTTADRFGNAGTEKVDRRDRWPIGKGTSNTR